LRELEEETGLTPGDVTLVPGFEHTERYRFTLGQGDERTIVQKQVTYFLAETKWRRDRLSPKEAHRHAWLEFEDAMRRLRYPARRRIPRAAVEAGGCLTGAEARGEPGGGGGRAASGRGPGAASAGVASAEHRIRKHCAEPSGDQGIGQGEGLAEHVVPGDAAQRLHRVGQHPAGPRDEEQPAVPPAAPAPALHEHPPEPSIHFQATQIDRALGALRRPGLRTRLAGALRWSVHPHDLEAAGAGRRDPHHALPLTRHAPAPLELGA